MCGIFGVSGKWATTHNTEKFLKYCTIAGAVRGVDSTGLIFHKNDKTDPVTYLKKAVNGTTFVETFFDPSVNMGTNVHSVVGHNRAATIGSVNDDTAHPFIEKQICGVHNGTLSQGWRSDLQVSKRCDVDSRGLYRAIANRGIDWTVGNLYGAAALVWVDCSDQKTYVYRNSQRPLCYATNSQGSTVWYASEAGMLSWLLSKANIAHTGIKDFKVNTLYDITGGEVRELREIAPANRVVTTPPARGASTKASPTTCLQTKNDSSKSKNVGQNTTATVSLAPSGSRILPRGKGLRWQKGVSFRGDEMSEEELSAGIIGEWAELGYVVYNCFCCDKPIDSPSFLESTTDMDIKIHEGCFSDYRVNHSADDPVIILRRNEKLRKTA